MSRYIEKGFSDLLVVCGFPIVRLEQPAVRVATRIWRMVFDHNTGSNLPDNGVIIVQERIIDILGDYCMVTL